MFSTGHTDSASIRTVTAITRTANHVGSGPGRRQRQQPPEPGVVDRGEGQRDRQEVQPGEVAAAHQPALGDDHDDGGDRRHRLGEEQQERHDELGDVVGEHLRAVQRARQVVEEPARRARERLGLVVVLEAGEVAPAAVAAQLDQARAELDAEQQPDEQPQDRCGRGDVRGSEERHEEPGLEQQRLPAEAVPDLADVDDRQVEHPEHGPQRDAGAEREDVGGARERGDGEDEAERGDDPEDRVRVAQVEQARVAAEGRAREEARDRRQAALADQRAELRQRDGERDDVDERDEVLDHPAGGRVVGRGEPVGHGASPRVRGPRPTRRGVRSMRAALRRS